MIYAVERKYDKKILIVNYRTDLWTEFSVFNCIDNGKKSYDIRRKSISEYLNISLARRGRERKIRLKIGKIRASGRTGEGRGKREDRKILWINLVKREI